MWPTQVLFGPLLVSLAHATDIYVSPGGSDGNDGTSSSRAFKSLGRARDAVRSLVGGSLDQDVNVRLAAGIYTVLSPLNLTSADSGRGGFRVNWIGEAGSVVSGGLKVSGWVAGSDGVYSASVPVRTQSRNLYVGGKAANYARRKIADRKDFTFTNTSMKWNLENYDWLMDTEGIAGAEVRFISSFTDRYALIQSVGNRELVMKQTNWANQIIGWDTVSKPFAEFGVWVQNSRALLVEGGQFYLDSEAGKIYYKPLRGEDMLIIETYLGVQEALVTITGTYDSPAHDITFQGLGFVRPEQPVPGYRHTRLTVGFQAHSTWLYPGAFGYADQQTGGFIGEDKMYPEHEATRPHWWQMPSAFQISAANKINVTGCSFTQLGAGGLGVGNDPNAHLSGIGLGTSDISIADGYFTQVMGNSITVGGIQANAHHPSDTRMTIAGISISGNIFTNNSALFSSTVPILVTYLHHSTISNNDVSSVPYSRICHGYGWGSNDAGGSKEYENRGLYQYQPRYTTPTTLHSNRIAGNLVHGYGFSHTDLGGVYTLSRSPATYVADNYVYDSGYWGLYNDEGSNSLVQTGNTLFGDQGWYVANRNGPMHTGNNTLADNYGQTGRPLADHPAGSGPEGDTYLRNYIVAGVDATSAAAQRMAYRAGVVPGRRAGRPVSNDEAGLADGWVALATTADGSGDVDATRLLAVNVTNFDDVDYTGAAFAVTTTDEGAALAPVDVPATLPADASVLATYRCVGAGRCQSPDIRATVQYLNPRLGIARTLTVGGRVELGGAGREDGAE